MKHAQLKTELVSAVPSSQTLVSSRFAGFLASTLLACWSSRCRTKSILVRKGCLQVAAEREFVMGLQQQGRAVVHSTACEGMRECGEGDVDASCHWSTDGRYMCLRQELPFPPLLP